MLVSRFSRNLAVVLLEDEAKRKSDGKVIVGNRAFSYSEVVESIKKGEKKFSKLLDSLAMMIEQSDELKRRAFEVARKNGIDCSS